MNRTIIQAAAILCLVMLLLALAPGSPVYADFGINWVGLFFNCTDFNCAAIQPPASYPNGINAIWSTGPPTDGLGVPVAGVNADNFSVRFSSTQNFAAGIYDFILTSQDGIRLYIDGSIVLDQFVARPLTTNTVSVTLTGGSHSLIVEYFNAVGPATVQVQWFLQGSTTLQPSLTPLPVATAQVINVRGLAVRTGPYLGASFITTARPDNTYNVTAKNQTEGVFTWYLIQVGEKTGWASGRYLQITGDPNLVPTVGTIFDQIDTVPDIGVTGVPRAVMNFRVRPSVRTARIGQIPWGASVSVIGRTIQGGRNFWLQVRYNGQVGWIFAPYVTINGILDAVPVR